jgi:hypothetical protein
VSILLLVLALGDEPVDFERDIRPLLAGRCLSCHGPGTTKAGLSFDNLEKASSTLKSGVRAIVPGKPAESALLARVGSADPEERMPPKGAPLKPVEIDRLRRWIAAGAEWPVHWAYRPLRKPEPPAVEAANPIDRFIRAKLKERGLSPSPEADRRTLARRVSIDLTGLPPTPEEEALEYEALVDRLLASPRYGERWARHWMDAAHFAETHGHDQDRPREHAWPYRDYLIRAFNEDKPYARFVQEQVAGDVLFPGDPAAITATGFLAAGPWDESSLRDIQPDSIDRQIGRVLDRDDIVTTALSTFSSATVHCARCHDHKFDPIPQREYYRLQAVFAGIDKANRPYDLDPAVAARRKALTERLVRIEPDDVRATPEEVEAWRKTLRAAPAWTPLETVEAKSEHGSELTKQPDGSILAGGPKPERDTYTVSVRSPLSRITAVRVDVLPHDSHPAKGPGRAVNGNLHLSEFAVLVDEKPLALAKPRADFDQAGWECPKAIDGDPTTAWGIHPKEGQPHHVVFPLKSPVEAAALVLRLAQDHGRSHLIGRFRLSATDAADPLGSDEVPKDTSEGSIARFVLRRRLERELAALPPQSLVYSGTPHFKPDGSFTPSGGPRPVHVLHRGNISQPGEEVSAGALSVMPVSFESLSDEGARRAAFARWLTDSRNVLTWRSIANRVWHHHFGRGIVDTPNDFGRMGGTPTHPELLDWLAATLLEEGGSLKSLHRRIVTSAAYRQSSAHRAEPAQRDADNHLLWRANRRRLDAETIRDAVLQASGKLDLTMGGPSVRQFVQKPGIHVTPDVNYDQFSADDPANHRRSVYRFLFRTIPDPFMETLDCPDASQLAPKREASVTALQALSMLNDKFIARQSEHLAARASGDPERIFRLVLGRAPTEKEAAAVRTYASKHGAAHAARMLFNTNEFMFVE